ncbi:hypothetical protein MNBD_PLANCTO03-298, partial [hydrothermal vent metagenome]
VLWVVLVVVLGAGVLPGCSSRPMVRPEPEPIVLPDEAPADFTLSVTVLGPASETAEIAETPRALRPGRYIVGPDGVLRAAVGPGATPRVFPRQTRQLDETQRQRLWRVVVNTGLLDGITLTAIDNTETFFPNRNRPTALVYVRQGGESSHFAVRLPVGDAESPEVVRLLDELAELAWIPE